MPPDSQETTEFGDLVAFAGDDDEGLGTFLFQPPEITDAKHRECRIFVLNAVRSLRPVADSFWEWLEWVERNYSFPPPEDEDERPDRPKPVMKPDPPGAVLQYERAWLRDKKSPPSRDVKLWLDANHRMARTLALSIRDRGCTEALPVLADALEEAGCTSADLLDSCRTGDPDIDRAWAIQMLLGNE